MTAATFDTVARALTQAKFTFAKTMPHIPHHYTLRKDWAEDVAFEDVVQFIRDNGYDDKWGDRTFTYWHLNGKRYWTMGSPLSETILINRADIPARLREPYDEMADNYDDLYQGDQFDKENDDVFSFIPLHVGSLLDVGCGTGLTLDYCAPARYVGIDPSIQMLGRMRRKFKFPSGYDLVRTGLESFWTDEKFDFVTCLFGAASYIPSEQVLRIPSFVRPGGGYVVTLYERGYTPKTHAAGVSIDVYDHPDDILPDTRMVRVGGHRVLIGGTSARIRRRRARGG